MELSKPLDASDVTAEDAKSEVVRLRTQLRSLMIESLEGGLVPDTFSTGGKPIEWETGGRSLRPLSYCMGLPCQPAHTLTVTSPSTVGKEVSTTPSNHCLRGTPGLRVVLPQAGKSFPRSCSHIPCLEAQKA